MADEEQTGSQEQEQQQAPRQEASGGSKALLIRAALAAAVGLGAAGGGYVAAMMMHSSPKPAKAAGEEQAPPPVSNVNDEDLAYYELDPIVANLNEPRLARYIRATITLAVAKDDLGTVSSTLDSNKPRLKDWINRYLSGCTPDDTRGEDNQNRIRREIRELLNEQFWPDQRPLIAEVHFTEFVVQ